MSLSFDLLAFLAPAGGQRLANSLAVTCRRMNKLIAERFPVTRKPVSITHFLDPAQGYKRRPNIHGFFPCVKAQGDELRHVPWATQRLMLFVDTNFDFKNAVFPSRMEELNLEIFRNETLERLCLHSVVRVLRFGDSFDQPVDDLELPDTLETLSFGRWFNQSLSRLKLPSGLRRLEINSLYFNSSLDEVVFPESLEALVINGAASTFKGPKKFPHHLKELRLWDEFNESLECLPVGLEKLVLGKRFNQPIDWSDLPASLRHLELGEDFNQPIQDCSGNSLQVITFGLCFNQHLDDVVWPDTLRHLTLGFNTTTPISRLPANLISMQFGATYNHPVDNLHLPGTLVNLSFGFRFFQDLEVLKFPESLRSLTVGECMTSKIHKPGFFCTAFRKMEDPFDVYYVTYEKTV